jgi:hypothetical protein
MPEYILERVRALQRYKIYIHKFVYFYIYINIYVSLYIHKYLCIYNSYIYTCIYLWKSVFFVRN